MTLEQVVRHDVTPRCRECPRAAAVLIDGAAFCGDHAIIAWRRRLERTNART